MVSVDRRSITQVKPLVPRSGAPSSPRIASIGEGAVDLLAGQRPRSLGRPWLTTSCAVAFVSKASVSRRNRRSRALGHLRALARSTGHNFGDFLDGFVHSFCFMSRRVIPAGSTAMPTGSAGCEARLRLSGPRDQQCRVSTPDSIFHAATQISGAIQYRGSGPVSDLVDSLARCALQA